MAKKSVNVEVKLQNVRGSFLHVFEVQVFRDPKTGAERRTFNGNFLISKTTPEGKATIAAVKEAMRKARDAKWGDDPPKLKADKLCLRDGDEESYDGYAGMMFVSASSPEDRPPGVVDRNPNKILTKRDGKPYSGCYVNVVLNIWCQDNEYGKRINASLECVQFVKDGEAFGAQQVDPRSAFADLGDDDSDDAPPARRRPPADEDDDDLLG